MTEREIQATAQSVGAALEKEHEKALIDYLQRIVPLYKDEAHKCIQGLRKHRSCCINRKRWGFTLWKDGDGWAVRAYREHSKRRAKIEVIIYEDSAGEAVESIAWLMDGFDTILDGEAAR